MNKVLATKEKKKKKKFLYPISLSTDPNQTKLKKKKKSPGLIATTLPNDFSGPQREDRKGRLENCMSVICGSV